MHMEWDEEKDRINRAKHGISLARAAGLDWPRGETFSDRRADYGEDREVLYAYLGLRLFVCVFTRRGNLRRIISLRKANKREIRDYGKDSAHPSDQ